MSTSEHIQDLQENVDYLKEALEANHRQVLPLLMIRQSIRISLLNAIEKLSDARARSEQQAVTEAMVSR